MPAKTPIAKHCSGGSARAFILRPAPSRLLRAWLIATHVLAAFGVLYLPVVWEWKAAFLGLLPAHAYLRRPRLPELIVRNRNGLWALPESGRTALSLSTASRYGTWWAELHLVGAGRAYRRLLCRDQLAAEDWRILQLALRHPGRRRRLS